MTVAEQTKPDVLAADGMPPRRKLSRREYGILIDAGAFVGERVELIDGVIYRMSPASPQHNEAIRIVRRLLARQLPVNLDVDSQLDFAVSDDTQVEPDLAVIPMADYRHEHPSEALLAIEMARSSHQKDLEAKPLMYAQAGVPEYWVFDLDNRVFVRHTAPADTGYTEVEQWQVDGTETPDSVTFSGVEIPFEDVFGPKLTADQTASGSK